MGTIRKVKVPKVAVDPGYLERPKEEEGSISFHCLIVAGKVLLILLIAYQILQIMGKHVLKEIRQNLTIDESNKSNLLPAFESLVGI